MNDMPTSWNHDPMRSKRVCFVTFEIAPFTAGGIGTFMHNTLHAYASDDADVHVLYCGTQSIDRLTFAAVFPGVALHVLDLDTYDGACDGSDDPPRKYMESRFQWYSHVVMRELRRLERKFDAFDVIEFPDWGGFAFYSLQEKKLGRAFLSTALAVRLHATDSLLRNYETRPWGFENLLLADMERKALADADVVVGHLYATVDEYMRRYGFDDHWRRKVVVGPPPVKVGRPTNRTTLVNPANTPILFTSKLQSIKRPEVFMQGVCAFALACSEYRGDIIITAFDFVADYGARIRKLVPAALKDRVQFLPGMPREARESLISRSVVVLPNAFEAFCFAAYEASLLGAVVILNGNNVSFGENTPWLSGVNCIKFDGSAESLTATLCRVFSTEQACGDLRPVEILHDEIPYWQKLPIHRRHELRVRRGAQPTVTAIVPHSDTPLELQRLVVDLLEQEDIPLRILIVDNGSESDAARLVLDDLQAMVESSDVIGMIRAPARRSCASLLNLALGSIDTPYAAVLYPGMGLRPGFLREAAESLDAEAEFDMVVPSAAVVGGRDDGKPVMGFFLPLGESIYVGLHLNRSCPYAFVMRTERLVALRFEEEMTSEPEWELCLRAVTNGSRCIVTPNACMDLPLSLACSLTWSSETERRANVEVVRRVVEARTAGGVVPFHCIGDAERIHVEWFSKQSEQWTGGSTVDNIEWRRRYEELRSAESVRLALAVASRIKRVMPSGLEWLRGRLFGGQRN